MSLMRNETLTAMCYYCVGSPPPFFFQCLLTGHFAGVPRHRAGDIILSRCRDDYPRAHAVLEIHHRCIIAGPLAGRQHAPVAMDDDDGIGQGRKIAAVKDLHSHLHLWKRNIVHRK